MSRPTGRLGRVSRPVALLAVLAITTAWSPAPHAAAPPAGAGGSPGADWRAAAPSQVVLERHLARAAAAEAADDGRWDPFAASPRSSGSDGRRVPPAWARTGVEEEVVDRPPAPRFSGRNHLWIPALGVSEPIVPFPCPRQRPPDHYTYRWGCAGKNNVYILGHASGVMKPLHDAFVAGRLRVGMFAWYANPAGEVTKYEVRFWRLTRPVGTTAWWIAPQPVPSMTLQTCFGRYSQWRLKVRLVAVE